VLSGNFTICPPAISQHAAVKAFVPESYDELDGHIRHYADNRRALLAGLPQIGITTFAPALGAFYVYADIGHVTHDSLAWCRQLLDDTGVALASGVDFDPTNGGSFVRISFAGSKPDIHEGISRLGTYLGQ
jgi:aspartate/methionine/tyrosine aminotransferase